MWKSKCVALPLRSGRMAEIIKLLVQIPDFFDEKNAGASIRPVGDMA